MYHNAGWGHFSTKTAEDVRNEIAPSSKKGGISSDSCADTEGETYAARSSNRNVGENM